MWTVAALLFSTVQYEEEEEHVMAKERADSQGYWPEMFKAKAHTGLTQDQQEQQLWRFPAQWEHECVGFSLQTELTFIYNYHSSFFFFFWQVCEQDMEMQYNSWHLQYTDVYTASTQEQQSL